VFFLAGPKYDDGGNNVGWYTFLGLYSRREHFLRTLS
jgi:hypothetical protein